MYYRYRGRTLVVSRICSFFNCLKNRIIKIDIDDLSKYKTKITQHVKEKYVSDMIHNYKLQMDNIPFFVLRDLCETLTLYDAFEIYYELDEPIDKDYVKMLNRKLSKVSYIPKKIRAQIANDKLDLLKLFQTPNNEMDAREILTVFRALVLRFFLQDIECRENLFKIKYIYIGKRNYFKKYSIFSKKHLNKKNRDIYYQDFVCKILKFYFHNKLYYETRTNILPIIGYKNNIPIFDPKLISLDTPTYSFRTLQIINTTYMALFDSN